MSAQDNASSLAAICQDCDTLCNGCNIENNTPVLRCTTMIDHAKSGTVTTTIEGVIVEPGYWRASSQSRNVLACFNANACLGGLTGDPDFCLIGYKGPCESTIMNMFARLPGTCIGLSSICIMCVVCFAPRRCTKLHAVINI